MSGRSMPRKVSRRTLIKAAASGAGVLILAACARQAVPTPTQMPEPTKVSEQPTQAPEPTQTPEPTKVAEPTKAASCPNGSVVVRVHDWSSADRQEYWDQVIKAFNDAHPCIKAESVKLPEDRAVRLNEISAGTAPDLVGFDSSDLPRVYMMGGLMDLTPFVEKDESFKPDEEFFESVWKTGFVDGKPVAIAKDYSVSAFYVNVGLFEKAGLEIPKEGWTYDDYLRLAQLLTIDKNGNNATSPDFDPKNVVQWGTSTPYWGGDTGWWRGFQSFLYSWGAHTISDDGKTTTGYLNSDKAVAAWTWFRDMVHKYHVAPDATYLAATNVANDKLFAQGQLAIAGTYWGPWFQDTFNQTPGLKWTVVPLPTGPGGHWGAICGWAGASTPSRNTRTRPGSCSSGSPRSRASASSPSRRLLVTKVLLHSCRRSRIPTGASSWLKCRIRTASTT